MSGQPMWQVNAISVRNSKVVVIHNTLSIDIFLKISYILHEIPGLAAAILGLIVMSRSQFIPKLGLSTFNTIRKVQLHNIYSIHGYEQWETEFFQELRLCIDKNSLTLAT
jgi:hypothetical protein